MKDLIEPLIISKRINQIRMKKLFIIITILSTLNSASIYAQSESDIATYLKSNNVNGAMLSQSNADKLSQINLATLNPNKNSTIVTNTAADSFKQGLKAQTSSSTNLNSESLVQPAIQEKKTASVYGQDYFNKNQIQLFEKVPNGKAPDNYILEAGDELNISIWGNSELNEVYRVDEDGFIQPSIVGRIFLKGLTFKEAQSVITKRFGASYDLNASRIAIRLNYSRSISVHIVGEVKNPGTYSISAINSAFNAIIAANGPDSIGSVRNIYIKRNGKVVKQLDLYDFLINPKSDGEFYLMNNDFIVVPALSKVITIKGEIKRPGKYELKAEDELNELIKFCGGLKANAFKSSIQIARYQNNKLQLEEVSLNQTESPVPLKDGDVITVRGINTQMSNYAIIKGAVNVPDKYEITEATHISNLIENAGGLIDRSFTTTGYLLRYEDNLTRMYYRFNVDSILKNTKDETNLLVQPYDEIIIFNKEKFYDSITVRISGNVRKPGVYDYGTKLTLKDLIYFAGGLDLEAANNRIEIARINRNGDLPTIKAIIKTVIIGSDLNMDKESENFIIEPFDEVFVRRLPGANMPQFVKISGEVKYPGTYVITNNNEKIMDVIKRAGGLTPYAFTIGAKLNRAEDNIGIVILDLKKAQSKPKSEFNYVIKNGDSINIPKMNEIITVFGAVAYSGIDTLGKVNTPFIKNKSAKFYINNYIGGFDKNAKRRKLVVIEANGQIRKTRNLLLLNIYPIVHAGSKIYVPFKATSKETVNKTPTDWNRVIEGFTIKATGIITLALIMKNLLKKS